MNKKSVLITICLVLIMSFCYVSTFITTEVVDYRSIATKSKGDSSFTAIFVIALFAMVIGYFVFLKLTINKSIKKDVSKEILRRQNQKEQKEYAELLALYGYSKEDMIDATFDAYSRVESAYSDLAIDKVKKLLFPELYSTYRKQQRSIRLRKLKNIITDIRFRSGKILSATETEGYLIVNIQLNITKRDYLVNTKDKSIISGYTNKLRNFSYVLSVTVDKKAKVTNCPKCSGKLDVKSINKCRYCGTKITRNNTVTIARIGFIK